MSDKEISLAQIKNVVKKLSNQPSSDTWLTTQLEYMKVYYPDFYEEIMKELNKYE
jgi:hypothetical protein